MLLVKKLVLNVKQKILVEHVLHLLIDAKVVLDKVLLHVKPVLKITVKFVMLMLLSVKHASKVSM